MNEIKRDVFVLSDVYRQPIDYVRATNAIPIVFNFCDFSIPSNATANVFAYKPSGTAVYSAASVSGLTVTVDVTTQMFAEAGKTKLQVTIINGEDVLVTFAQEVNVHDNYTNGDIPPSQNEATFFQQAQEAIDNANEAAENAQNFTNAANQVLEAIQGAIQGTLINDNEASANTVYSSAKVQPFISQTALNQQAIGIGLSCKNLIPYPYDDTTVTRNGITFTDNGDGSITMQGICVNSRAYFNLQTRADTTNTPFTLYPGTYILSGNASNTVMGLGYTGNDGGYVGLANIYNDSPVTFTVTKEINTIQIQLAADPGDDLTEPVTVYPMLRLASITDGTWEPYKQSINEKVSGMGVYRDFKAVLTDFNIDVQNYTMQDFLPLLPRNISISFTNNTQTAPHITDVPVPQGTVKVITGNTMHYNNAIYYANNYPTRTYRYKVDGNISDNDAWGEFVATAPVSTAQQGQIPVVQANGNWGNVDATAVIGAAMQTVTTNASGVANFTRADSFNMGGILLASTPEGFTGIYMVYVQSGVAHATAINQTYLPLPTVAFNGYLTVSGFDENTACVLIIATSE